MSGGDAAPTYEDVNTAEEGVTEAGIAAISDDDPAASDDATAGADATTSDGAAIGADATATSENAAEPDATANEAASADAASPADDANADAPVDIADAAVREGIAATAGTPVEQLQALGIATDPSQVEGYDPAADEEPAEDADAPTGYSEAAAVSDEYGISAQSDSSVRVGDWSYRTEELSSGQTVYVINGYYGSASSITLPATLGGKQMYSVNFWYGGLPSTVTSVTIPASIKEIGASAFYGTKVASVTFAANSQLTSIGEQAFAQTPLKEFTLPANVKKLGHNAFMSSLLTKLTLNTELEPMVYTGTVWSGSNSYEVTEHYNPCGGCSTVTFVVPSGCKNYRVENGALLSRDGTILYAQMSNLGGGTYTVPSGVKYLGSYAMSNNTTFSDIVLPQGLTTMEQYCLYRTNITALDMPDSVTHVQGNICQSCTKLTTVRISNNLEELGECAGWECFYGCSNLTSLTLGSKLRVIGNACFAGSKLTSVNLPASVQQLNYGAFGDIPTLKSVTGGSGLRYIYRYAFRNAGITNFTFGKNLKFVSNEAFYNCNFTPSYPSYMDEQADGYYVYDGYLAVQGDKSYSLAWQVLDLVNQERAKQGLSALTMDKELLDAAMQRAAETSICFDHTRPTEQDCFTASSKMTRENIASGLTTAQAVMNQWMNSSGHKANILSSDTKSIGIGCVKVSGRYFWVQCFGTSEATTVSKPADVSDAIMRVPYTTSGLSAFGSRFEIYPVASNGASVTATYGALQEGSSQRYALFTYPWGANYGAITLIDNSCINWSFSGSGAKFNASTATVTGTGSGSFTLTASVGAGTVKQTLSRDTQAAVYKVTFSSNGGSGVASQSVTSGKKVTKPADPTKGGYTFKGWYSDSALTKAYDFSSAVRSNLTLYAKWAANSYTVTFNANGGSSVKAQTVQYGGKVGKPSDPTRSGYAFKGWYSDKGLTKAYNFSTAITGNLTLYAKWEAKQAGAPTSFKDVPSGKWYTDWVAQAAKAGLMTGMKDAAGNYTGYFEPNRGITRAEVATVLWRVAGSPSAGSSTMSDMHGHWAEKAVAWCTAKGIVTGYTTGPDAGRFLPDKQVSREELATMVWRFAKWSGVKTSNPPKTAFNACGDTQLVPDWSREALTWCAAAGIITGVQGGAKPMLVPQDGATRAMAAKIFVQTQKITSGQMSPYAEEESEAASAEITFDAVEATTQVTLGQTQDGLAYAVVPQGALDAAGNAYVEGQTYAELGGRYVGAGVYVTAYTGESADLALPAQIEGTDVVAANLSWKGDDETVTPDPDGRTRLASLALTRGCKLASLDASGSLIAQVVLAGEESLGGLPELRYLDLSGTQVAALDTAAFPALERLALRGCPLTSESLATLATWAGATGLTADLEGTGAKDEQADGSNESNGEAGDGSNAADTNQAGNPGAADGNQTGSFDAIDADQAGSESGSNSAGVTPDADAADKQAGQGGDTSDAGSTDPTEDALPGSGESSSQLPEFADAAGESAGSEPGGIDAEEAHVASLEADAVAASTAESAQTEAFEEIAA